MTPHKIIFSFLSWFCSKHNGDSRLCAYYNVWCVEKITTIQHSAVITRSIFCTIVIIDTHSSPIRVEYWVSVVILKSDSLSATIIAVPYVMSRYNGNWLHEFHARSCSLDTEINFLSTTSCKYDLAHFVMTGENPHHNDFCSVHFTITTWRRGRVSGLMVSCLDKAIISLMTSPWLKWFSLT